MSVGTKCAWIRLPISEAKLCSSSSDWSVESFWAGSAGGGRYISEIILDISCCSTLNRTEQNQVTICCQHHQEPVQTSSVQFRLTTPPAGSPGRLSAGRGPAQWPVPGQGGQSKSGEGRPDPGTGPEEETDPHPTPQPPHPQHSPPPEGGGDNNIINSQSLFLLLTTESVDRSWKSVGK